MGRLKKYVSSIWENRRENRLYNIAIGCLDFGVYYGGLHTAHNLNGGELPVWAALVALPVGVYCICDGVARIFLNESLLPDDCEIRYE